MYVPLVILLFTVYASAFDGQSTDTVAEFKDTRVVETIHEVCELTGYEVNGLKWTRCSKGRISIKGCALECGVKLAFGEKYVDELAEWLCEKLGEQDVILRPVSCVYHGRVVPIGKTFSSGSFFYTCAKRPNGVGIDAIGCKARDGTFVPLGHKFTHGNFVFQCYKEDKRIRISGVECVDKHGIRRRIGESWRHGSYYYECEKNGNSSLLVRAVACSDLSGVRVEPGEEFVTGPTVYKCFEHNGRLRIETTGCYAKDHRTLQPTKFPFGDKWFEAYGEKFGYIMQCTRTDIGVTRTAVECALLRADGQYYFLSVGCGTEVDRRVFACKIINEKGHVAARLTKRKESTLQETLAIFGVKYCKLRAQPYPNGAEYPEIDDQMELPPPGQAPAQLSLTPDAFDYAKFAVTSSEVAADFGESEVTSLMEEAPAITVAHPGMTPTPEDSDESRSPSPVVIEDGKSEGDESL